MSERAYLLGFFSIIAVVIISLIAATTFYNYSKNGQIVDLIKSGNDPLKIRCALEDSMGTQPACMIAGLGK